MKNLRKICFGVAGLAAISGAIYYIYRKQQGNTSFQNHFEQIRYQVYGLNKFQYNKIQRSFNQAYYNDVEKSLIQYSKDSMISQEGEGIFSRVCMSELEGKYFYECVDCSIQYQYNDKKKDDKSYYSHQFCEDCFDMEIHKNHKYKLIFSQSRGLCDCGCSQLIKEESFCKKHKGFTGLKDQLVAQNPILKENITIFFKELFYILIDGQADYLYKLQQNQVDKKQKESKNNSFLINKENQSNLNQKADFQILESNKSIQFNVLLTLILDQIQVLIDIDHSFVYILIGILQTSIDKPTRVNTSNTDKFELLDEKKIDDQETIIEYLIRMISQFNDQNDKSYLKLIKLMCWADSTLLIFIAKKHQRLLLHTVYQKEIQVEDQKVQSLHFNNIIDIFRMAFWMKNIPHEQYYDQNVHLKVLQIYEFLLKSGISCIYDGYKSLNYCLELLDQLFVNPTNLENYDNLNQLITKIFDYIQFIQEKSTYINNQEYLEKIIERQSIFQNNIFLEHCFVKLVQKILKNLGKIASKEKQNEILKKICTLYKQNIDKIYNVVSQKFNNLTKYLYACSSIIPIIIEIINLKEGWKFSRETILKALNESFEFKQENELSIFVDKIQTILNQNLFLIKHDKRVQIHMAQIYSIQQSPYSQQIIQGYLNIFIRAQFMQYDKIVLSKQLISLVSKENIIKTSYQCCQQVQIKLDEPLSFEYVTYLILPFNQIKQIFFDQTPYLNYFYSFLQNQDQTQIDQIIENVMKCNILWFHVNGQPANQLKEKMNDVIRKNKLVESYFDKHKISEDSQIEEISKNIKNNKSKLSAFNCSRYLITLLNFEFSNYVSPLENQLYTKGIINNLFLFQKQLIIQYICDVSLFESLIQFLKSNLPQINILYYQYSDYFILVDDLIQLQKENPELFDEDQKTELITIQAKLSSNEINTLLLDIIQILESNQSGIHQKNPTSYQDFQQSIRKYIQN